jgi:hypothetical protein
MCAQTLQQAGLIKYSRGEIKILSRAGLEDSTCECYAAIQGYKERASRPLQ